MNKRAIAFHLREAAEQLEKSIQAVTGGAEYDMEAFRVDMRHLYHHLNTAWNGRELADEQHDRPEMFERLRVFPVATELLL